MKYTDIERLIALIDCYRWATHLSRMKSEMGPYIVDGLDENVTAVIESLETSIQEFIDIIEQSEPAEPRQ